MCVSVARFQEHQFLQLAVVAEGFFNTQRRNLGFAFPACGLELAGHLGARKHLTYLGVCVYGKPSVQAVALRFGSSDKNLLQITDFLSFASPFIEQFSEVATMGVEV